MNNDRSDITPDALQEIIHRAYETTQTPDETRIRLIRHRLMANQPSKSCSQQKKPRRFSIWVFGFAFVAFGAAASWWFSDILWPTQPVAVGEKLPAEINQNHRPDIASQQPGHKKDSAVSRDSDIHGNDTASDERIIYRHEPF